MYCKRSYDNYSEIKDLEPVLPLSIVISVIGGAAAGFLTLGKKFSEVDVRYSTHIEKIDTRIDQIELRLAKEYVDRQDLQVILERLDDRIDRMDSKLDRILFTSTAAQMNYDKNAPNI